MKDIYSPLDIDEEWDDITPDMAGVAVLDNPNTQAVTKLAVTSEKAPDLSGNDGTSTLAPAAEVTAEAPAEMPNTNMAQGLNESTAEDAAFKVANADMGMGMDSAPAKTDGTLNIGEINPATTAAAPATEMAIPGADEMPKADTKEATVTPVPVIDMNAATSEMKDSGDNKIEVGKSYTPEEKPVTGDRFEGMKTEEKEAPKEAPANTEEPAAAELPVTHADKKDLMVDEGDSGSEMKFDMNEAPSVSHSKLESLMSDWEDMKQRTQDRLNDLKSEKEDMLAKLEQELKDTQDKISATEAERDDIDAKLNELV